MTSAKDRPYPPVAQEVVVRQVRILHLTDDNATLLCTGGPIYEEARRAAAAVDATGEYREVCPACLRVDAERTVAAREAEKREAHR